LLYLHLTGMLNDFADKLAVLDVCPDLLRQRILTIVILTRQVDIDTRALAREDLRVLAILAEVDGRAVDLVEQHCGQGADDLEREVGALDDVDRGDERVDDDGCAARVIDGDGVGLAVDADGGVLAAGDEDGVVDFGVEFDDFARAVEVILRRTSAKSFLALRENLR
jgi:hypothetical protein